jgi:hypothetical protein
MEEVEELPQTNNTTRDELRRKLRGKIKQKQSVRTSGMSKRDTQIMSDKIEKLMKFIEEKNITVNTSITEDLIEQITDIISLSEMKRLYSQIENNPNIHENFINFIKNVNEFKTP